ncbi:MAG: metallophosphoesterase [Methanomicrobiales archaeon]|nr:metallophosphoesterase [Methanomicrobiales archaeon]MDI6876599.1 metallophosphoesterase [Methanomicrobiales archaeon]
MLIGIISDTHDNLPRVDDAVRVLNRAEVGLVLHAGDYIAPFVLPRLADLDARMIGVFGNNDGERAGLHQKQQEFGNIDIRGPFARVVAGGIKIGLLHGHDGELLEALIEGQGFDAVVCGHTHRYAVERRGRSLVVNPGEVCGYVSGQSTLALLDTESRDVRRIQL